MVENQIGTLIPSLSLAITCDLSTQMGHESPFQTSMFQELFNGRRNFSIK
jgi:hypothetical protein